MSQLQFVQAEVVDRAFPGFVLGRRVWRHHVERDRRVHGENLVLLKKRFYVIACSKRR